jgi:peptidoglycan/LPS O-acetylase OafA/YrhL
MTKVDTYRYGEIDFLRGFACAAVVAFHYLSRGPAAGWMIDVNYPLMDAFTCYGYLGVHLFFIISGFLILLSAQDVTPRSFLASRAARLLPGFWFGSTLTAVTVWWAEDQRFMVSLPHFFINLTMVPHWFGVPYIDGAYWSLGYELHFYIYVWLVLRFRLLHRIDWLLSAWLAVSIINAVRPIWPLEFGLSAKWAPFFVAGGVFYLIKTRGFTVLRSTMLGVAYVLALVYTLRNAPTDLGLGTATNMQLVVVAGIVTLFFCIFGSIALGKWKFEAPRIVNLLGTLSYPVYVIHQVFGYVLYEKLRVLSGNPFLSLALTLLIVLGIAWAMHHLIEIPIAPRLKRQLLSRHMRTCNVGLKS